MHVPEHLSDILADFGDIPTERSGTAGHAGRAHVGDPVRQHIFEKHKIFFADAKFLSDYTVARVEKVVEALPTHLIERGVRAYSPFTTVQVKNAFHCDRPAR